ncbi:MAG TPA: EAL domain-containing protein [Steroidobacteraceae bacterium]|nr:EAL domain-containing protein [Steroidobacteraceae bacterium]
MQRERRRVLLLYAGAAIAIMVPMVAAVWLAEQQSLVRQERRAAALAAEILLRADRIAEQAKSATAELRAAGAQDPCSEQNIGLMRGLVIRSNLLVDVGYARGDVLLCSSFGREPVPIGAPTYASAPGFIVRVGVRLPPAPESPLVIVTDPKSGYTALISQSLPIDALTEESNVVLGLLSEQRKQPLTQRGALNPRWLERIGSSREGTFYDGTDLIVWKRSLQGDYVALAAIGRNRIEQDQRRIVLVLLPVGAAAAALLVLVAVRLARFETSMPRLLRNALKTSELFLVYQPIVSLETRAWVGAEALLRWRRPNGELIGPDLFIPIAESTRLMGRITEAVLKIFESEAGELLRARSDFHISLNLSTEDIGNPEIVDRLRAMIARMGIAGSSLHVEATERVFMNIEASRRNIRQLRAAGIQVAIDDFGTGYSSLSYLHNLEVDRLKIDKSFVDTIGTEAVTSQVVRHIIEMAKSLNMQMIAEGVETAAQAKFLRSHGVQYAQGWLFSKPISMKELMAQLLGEGGPRAGD